MSGNNAELGTILFWLLWFEEVLSPTVETSTLKRVSDYAALQESKYKSSQHAMTQAIQAIQCKFT